LPLIIQRREPRMPHALIVVRDEDASRHLEEAARARSFSVAMAKNAEAGLSQMETRFPDLLFLDRCFGGRTKEALLHQIQSSPGGSAVLVGPVGEREQYRNGRAEPMPSFLSSLGDPIEAGRVQAILEGVASSVAETRDLATERTCLEGIQFGHLQGSSPRMRKLCHLISRVAPSQASVLVSGESGSGKERVARTIHDLSPRRSGAFVAVNCGAISATLMESQIFGHEKGSFSGAVRRHRGLFEQAHGGTLLLDEITEMPLELQVKLLRVLETGSVVRVGAESALDVDVRILATTNRPPLEAVADGKLRTDLYYRLRILEVEVPPLRERMEDLPQLARAVLEEIGELEGRRKSISPEVMGTLQAYEWPGNVRELRNALYTAFLLSEGPELEAASVPDEVSGASRPDLEPSAIAILIPVRTSIREAERRLILMTLEHMEGRKDRTAEALGVSIKTLYNRLHEYGWMGGTEANGEA
jgi:two-component system, NtrC family, response regulator AtoC